MDKDLELRQRIDKMINEQLNKNTKHRNNLVGVIERANGRLKENKWYDFKRKRSDTRMVIKAQAICSFSIEYCKDLKEIRDELGRN